MVVAFSEIHFCSAVPAVLKRLESGWSPAQVGDARQPEQKLEDLDLKIEVLDQRMYSDLARTFLDILVSSCQFPPLSLRGSRISDSELCGTLWDRVIGWASSLDSWIVSQLGASSPIRNSR